jgi:hypothetical protein
MCFSVLRAEKHIQQMMVYLAAAGKKAGAGMHNNALA